jgi:hypothetical protein
MPSDQRTFPRCVKFRCQSKSVSESWRSLLLGVLVVVVWAIPAFVAPCVWGGPRIATSRRCLVAVLPRHTPHRRNDLPWGRSRSGNSRPADDFSDVFFSLMLGLNNYFVVHGGEEPFFPEIPAIVRTNGNPAVLFGTDQRITSRPAGQNGRLQRPEHDCTLVLRAANIKPD